MHGYAIGVDTSISFICKAREIRNRQRLDFDLFVEGKVTEPRGCELDGT
jgi:hypothetical protein